MCGISGQAVDEDGHRWFSSDVFDATDEENQTMAENLSMALAELLRKADAEPDVDTLREGVRVLTQALMELEVAQHLGAERYQRSPDRQGERNGYRDRNWDTRRRCSRPRRSGWRLTGNSARLSNVEVTLTLANTLTRTTHTRVGTLEPRGPRVR